MNRSCLKCTITYLKVECWNNSINYFIWIYSKRAIFYYYLYVTLTELYSLWSFYFSTFTFKLFLKWTLNFPFLVTLYDNFTRDWLLPRSQIQHETPDPSLTAKDSKWRIQTGTAAMLNLSNSVGNGLLGKYPGRCLSWWPEFRPCWMWPDLRTWDLGTIWHYELTSDFDTEPLMWRLLPRTSLNEM